MYIVGNLNGHHPPSHSFQHWALHLVSPLLPSPSDHLPHHSFPAGTARLSVPQTYTLAIPLPDRHQGFPHCCFPKLASVPVSSLSSFPLSSLSSLLAPHTSPAPFLYIALLSALQGPAQLGLPGTSRLHRGLSPAGHQLEGSRPPPLSPLSSTVQFAAPLLLWDRALYRHEHKEWVPSLES